jgi:UDP-glucose 4-epimerase
LAAVKTLVTGGAGFIGSNLVLALLARGDEVRILDNFSTGHRHNLADVEADVDLVEGDLRSYERVHNAVRGVDVIYHQGALPSVPRSLQDPLTTSAVNIEGTLNVLLTARDEGVRRVVFASSSSVYGSSGTLPRAEPAAVDPIAPYAVAKLAAERYSVAFARVYESPETVCLRYFNVFGPKQDPRSEYAAVIPIFIKAILAGEPVPINGDGGQSRDFTYVENVVAANIVAAEAPSDLVSGEVFNVATGNPVSVAQLADTIGEILGRPVRKEHRPTRAGDVRDSWADLTRASEILGWEPSVSLEEGLRRTAEHYESAFGVPLSG